MITAFLPRWPCRASPLWLGPALPLLLVLALPLALPLALALSKALDKLLELIGKVQQLVVGCLQVVVDRLLGLDGCPNGLLQTSLQQQLALLKPKQDTLQPRLVV